MECHLFAKEPLLFYQNSFSQSVGQKIGAKNDIIDERAHITTVVLVAGDASGGNLPAMLIFKGTPTPTGETAAANSIGRKFETSLDETGN